MVFTLKDIEKIEKRLFELSKNVRAKWREKTSEEKNDFEYDLELHLSNLESIFGI